MRRVARTVDAVVIGGGPGGSAAAVALAGAGWETVVLERRSTPRHKVCGEFLSPEAGATLRELGLEGAVNRLEPVRIERVRLSAPGGRPLDVPLSAAALGVSRHAFDAALLEEARRAGVEVRMGARALHVRREGGVYEVGMRGNGMEETFRARIVIGAWGAGARKAFKDPRAAGERASRSFGFPRADNGSASRLLGVKVHFEGVFIGPVTELYAFRGGYLGLSPVPGGRVNAAALLDRRAFGEDERSAEAWIASAARRHPGLARRLAGARPVPGTAAAVSPVVLDRRPLAWADCPLVGDAALRIPPLCGDGMSIALRSGLVCARLADLHLRGELTEDAWRREYGRFFRRECEGALRLGRLLQAAFGRPGAARLLFGIGRAVPGWASMAVRRTRLAEPDG